MLAGGKEMKSTGIIRGIDELGRLVIPKELRDKFDLKYKDEVEVYTEDDKIILKKYESGDIFTGNMEDLIEYKGKKISVNSIKEMVKLAEKSGYKI